MNFKQKLARGSGDAIIRIGDKTVSLYVARYTYRCRECLGELEYHNAGLCCATDKKHRGFIHKAEAARVADERAEQLAQVEAVYEIIDGKIVVRSDSNAY